MVTARTQTPLPLAWRIVMNGLMKPSKILSVVPIINSDPLSVDIELQCSLCDEVETLILSLNPDNLSWLRKNDFYFVCGRHRKWERN
jgi:hypothetical protein